MINKVPRFSLKKKRKIIPRAWHYDKKEVLTVRSMYHLLVNTKKRRED
jgi:hypothetical protein